jgi:3-oxoacyl-[acyl-carrier protein] reductase
MDLGLRDGVYIVTGGSSGLGLATAEALTADGARVVLSARNAGRLAQAADRLGPGRAGPSGSPRTTPTRRRRSGLSPRRSKPSAGWTEH